VTDSVLEGFLEKQYEQGLALANSSDLLELDPFELFPRGGPAPRHYVAAFNCNGLVKSRSGEVQMANRFILGIWFPEDYLRRVNPFEVLTWFKPAEVFHPNISGTHICAGRLTPGTPLTDILYQCFEIITYNKVTMREDDALNKEACSWARGNKFRFPIDNRPLKRARLEIEAAQVVKR
jgi:hypothetical protein